MFSTQLFESIVTNMSEQWYNFMKCFVNPIEFLGEKYTLENGWEYNKCPLIKLTIMLKKKEKKETKKKGKEKDKLKEKLQVI